MKIARQEAQAETLVSQGELFSLAFVLKNRPYWDGFLVGNMTVLLPSRCSFAKFSFCRF